MITNYVSIYEKIDFTVNLVVVKSFNSKNWEVCYNACKFVWLSHIKKTDTLSDVTNFLRFYLISSTKLGKLEEFVKVVSQKQQADINL